MASQTAPDREILPGNVIPRHYRLSLAPDFSSFKYKGKVDVELDVKESTSSILLNALDLEFHSASVKSGGNSIKSKNIAFDEDKQIATLDFEDKLSEKDQATLTIEFTGILNDKMAGFYRSSYVDSKTGEQKWLATTQMGIISKSPCSFRTDRRSPSISLLGSTYQDFAQSRMNLPLKLHLKSKSPPQKISWC